MRRSLKFTARLAVAMAVLVAASVAAVHVWQAWRLHRAKAAFEALGYPLREPEAVFEQLYPSVPTVQNGALKFLEAEALLRRKLDWHATPHGFARFDNVQWEKSNDVAEMAERAEVYLAGLTEPISLAHAGAELPAFRLPVKADSAPELVSLLEPRTWLELPTQFQFGSMLWPENSQFNDQYASDNDVWLVRLNLALEAATARAVASGDAAAVVRLFRTRLACVQAFAGIPDIDWQLFRCGYQANWYHDMYAIVGTMKFDGPQLAALLEMVENAPEFVAVPEAVAVSAVEPFARDTWFGGRPWEWSDTVEGIASRGVSRAFWRFNLIDHPHQGAGRGEGIAKVLAWMYRAGNLWDGGRATYLEMATEYIRTLRRHRAGEVTRSEVGVRRMRMRDALGSVRGSMGFAKTDLSVRVLRPTQPFTAFFTETEFLRVVLALELYRLDHHTYPQKLDSLTPRYLDLVPNDLMEPGVYRSEGVRYSLDDGGPFERSYSKWFPLTNRAPDAESRE